MRFISTDQLTPGMKLGKSLFGSDGQVLLKKGTELRESIVIRIKLLNYPGIYIEDGFSNDIEVDDIINDELRQAAVQKTKNFFAAAAKTGGNKFINKDMKDLTDLLNEIIDQVVKNRHLMVNAIDLKTFDDYTFQHSINVSVLSTLIGLSFEYSRRQLYSLAIAGLFHDIGKMFIDKNIINKKGKLANDEFNEIKNHPVYGFQYAKNNLNLTAESLVGIIQHHEKCDGKGYPYAKDSSSIHMNAKIIAICDVFDAITSNRTYHEPAPPSEALEYIMGNANKHFDMDVVNAFIQKVAVYPQGTGVELSNGEKGVVCENYEGLAMRPLVKVFTSNAAEQKYINLSDRENSSITIVGVLK